VAALAVGEGLQCVHARLRSEAMPSIACPAPGESGVPGWANRRTSCRKPTRRSRGVCGSLSTHRRLSTITRMGSVICRPTRWSSPVHGRSTTATGRMPSGGVSVVVAARGAGAGCAPGTSGVVRNADATATRHNGRGTLFSRLPVRMTLELAVRTNRLRSLARRAPTIGCLASSPDYREVRDDGCCRRRVLQFD
jgi:hypothetical protein